MGVFADFLWLEGESENMHELSCKDLGGLVDYLEASALDLCAYYKAEDTTNFDRGLVIDMLKKIDDLVSKAEVLLANFAEEQDKRNERKKERAEKRQRLRSRSTAADI